MMDERRFDTRKLINTPVRVYHPELGRLDGTANDISKGGIAIQLNSVKDLSNDLKQSPLFFRPINTDVLFEVACLRQTAEKLVLKFLD